jgi:hypothetical protein
MRLETFTNLKLDTIFLEQFFIAIVLSVWLADCDSNDIYAP